MTTPEAKWALFSATHPNGGEPKTRDAWRDISDICQRLNNNSEDASFRRENVILLPLPQSWPDLCRLQAFAAAGDIHCSVRLFGEPILVWPNEASTDTPEKA